MPKKIEFSMVIHNHQPVGNFDHVIHDACDKAYLPFLRTLLDFPRIRIGLHTSGCLLEWLESHRMEYFELVRELLRRGQLELLGGGMYEPILPILPEREAVLQLLRMKAYLSEKFEREASGMWLAERVWEPFLPEVIAQAYQYTLLDDHHFAGNAVPGLVASEYLTTESRGREIAVLPISRELRYAMPFKGVEHTERILRNLLDASAGKPLVVFGDDGEKFGVWPETHDWVFGRRWLSDFLAELTRWQADGWVELSLPGAAIASRPPAARVMLPPRSYEEMGQWTRIDFDHFAPDAFDPDRAASGPGTNDAESQLPGHFRNFQLKYPETDWLLRRVEEVSRLFSLYRVRYDDNPGILAQIELAHQELQRAECNCPYWHGVFGGIYLNYLRHAVNSALIRSEAILDKISGPAGLGSSRQGKIGKKMARALNEVQRCRYGSFAGFAIQPTRRERFVSVNEPGRLRAVADASAGLSVTRIEDKPSGWLATDVLARRREKYHDKLLEGHEYLLDEHASIHDRVVVKEEGLERFLAVDPHPRRSFVTYFAALPSSAPLLHKGMDQRGGPQSTCRDSSAAAEALVFSEQQVAGNILHPGFTLHKSIALTDGLLSFGIELLDGEPPADHGLFWVEFNLTALTDNADDRWLEADGLRHVLNAPLDFDAVASAALVDLWQGRRLTLSVGEPDADGPSGAGLRAMPLRLLTYPVYTVSSSEAGFERTYQGTCIMFGYAPQALREGISIKLSIAPAGG